VETTHFFHFSTCGRRKSAQTPTCDNGDALGLLIQFDNFVVMVKVIFGCESRVFIEN